MLANYFKNYVNTITKYTSTNYFRGLQFTMGKFLVRFMVTTAAVFIACFFQVADAADGVVDTLALSRESIDSVFLINNLGLLANHMNVDVAQANIIAAKVWDNPVFYSEVDIWNPISKKAFDVNNGGQLYLQIQQLFKIGGEHHRLAEYSRAGKKAAEFQYYDLLRNLRYQLHADYYNLNSLLKTKAVYLVEIEKAKSLEKALSESYDKGIIPLKDLVRIQSTLFQLQNDYTDLLNNISDLESELHQMTQIPPQKFIVPLISDNPQAGIDQLQLDSLYQTALTSRPDVEAQEALNEAAGWNLKYQRSLGVPGLTAGFDFFNNGAASFPNYYGLQLSIPLPVFNHNQAGIKEAKALVKQQDYVYQDAKLQAINDVTAAFEKLKQTASVDLNTQKTRNDSFEKLMQHITELYARKEISLKDLADYFDLYKEQSKSYNDYVAQLQIAREELNHSVGVEILK